MEKESAYLSTLWKGQTPSLEGAPVTQRSLVLTVLVLLGGWSSVEAAPRRIPLQALNQCLHGQLIDYTDNYGQHRRIWSPAVNQWRDLIVYLPPNFDPRCRYPLMIWLHGIASDEHQFVERGIPLLDAAMACGQLPPLIIAVPDGALHGRSNILETHTAFLNTRLGCFEDYLMVDVWNFLHANFPIRPERQAHVLAGISLGGGAAYHHAIKYRDRVGSVVGIYPPLNSRWLDCTGHYFGDFDPCCWGWRTSVRPGCAAVGRFGIVRIPIRRFAYPMYGRGPEAILQMSLNNPLEMLDYYHVRPGELEMFVAYGANDEFNLDAQIESFVYHAHQRGLPITVLRDPCGAHNAETARKFVDPIVRWLAPRLEPFRPRP